MDLREEIKKQLEKRKENTDERLQLDTMDFNGSKDQVVVTEFIGDSMRKVYFDIVIDGGEVLDIVRVKSGPRRS